MDRTRVVIVAAAVALAGFSRAMAEETRAAVVLLRVYNYAGVPADAMRGAREKVVRVYRDAGASVEWIEPLAKPADAVWSDMTTSQPTFAVRVMIRPKMITTNDSRRTSVMGMALAPDENGGTVSLFYDQVIREVRRYKQPIADLLAIAIAHEVGHLLLPPPSHAAGGIMRAAWDGDDIRHAVVGRLAFTASEASQIRARLAACCGSQPSSKAK